VTRLSPIPRWFKKGDLVTYNGILAYVQEVGLRSTQMLTVDAGEFLYVPNSRLSAAPLINHTKRDRRRASACSCCLLRTRVLSASLQLLTTSPFFAQVLKSFFVRRDTRSHSVRKALDAINAILDRPHIAPLVEKYGRAPRYELCGTPFRGPRPLRWLEQVGYARA